MQLQAGADCLQQRLVKIRPQATQWSYVVSIRSLGRRPWHISCQHVIHRCAKGVNIGCRSALSPIRKLLEWRIAGSEEHGLTRGRTGVPRARRPELEKK